MFALILTGISLLSGYLVLDDFFCIGPRD